MDNNLPKDPPPPFGSSFNSNPPDPPNIPLPVSFTQNNKYSERNDPPLAEFEPPVSEQKNF